MKRTITALLVLAVGLGTGSLAFAQEQPSNSDGASQDEASLVFADSGDDRVETADVETFGAGDLLRMVLVLTLVAAAVYGVISFLRRRSPVSDDDSDGPIRVLATRSLGAGRDVHVVRIGQEVMLLGGGDHGVQLLSRIEDRETIDELELRAAAAAPPRSTFRDLMRAFGSSGAPRPTQSGADAGAPSATPGSVAASIGGILGAQQQRLRRL